MSFPERFHQGRGAYGPLVMGLDPSGATLRSWGLTDDAEGLERFVDVVVEAAVGTVAVAKPQSAFYERHGWAGIRALSRLVSELRQSGVLVLLDAKRGDVGSTNEAYAEAYLGEAAAIPVDALTLTAYLGLGAMEAFFDRALASGSGLFIVTRSTNPEGRLLQTARGDDGLTVEAAIVTALSRRNRDAAGDEVGPFGAVFGAGHEPPQSLDLVGMNGLFLVPGLGAQGTTPADIGACFASCPDRALPSASRSLLAAGPDVARLRDATLALSAEVSAALS
jgi:orotidine-5'-phosphate decarboxylase